MKVRRMSMSAKIFLFVSALLLVSDIIIGMLFYQRAKNLLVSQMRENALNMCNCVAASVDGAVLGRIPEGDNDSDDYMYIYDQLALFRDNSNVEYVYTLKEAHGTAIYSVDTALDMPAENGEDFGAYDDTIKAAFRGTPGVDAEPYTDDWGTHYTAYSPIYDGKTVVGIACVDISFSWVQEQCKGILRLIIIICGLSFLAGMGILFIVKIKLSKGFSALNEKVAELAGGGGDLTKRIEIHSGDEFEVIGENVNKLVEYIREIIIKIQNSVNSLGNASSTMFGKLEEANSDTENVSSVLQELSSSMHETSEAMSDIDNLVGDINSVFGGIVDEVQGSSDYAHEMRRQAQKTGDDAKKAQAEADRNVKEMQDAVHEKIERSEAVHQIDVLTENILNITEQTSLLALNANIEAARAGESGRGFAVVASEIGKLASDSAAAAGEIQRVSSEVIQAVQDLAAEANNMIDFIDKNVHRSYERLVDTSEKYRDSALHVDDIMSKFSDMSTSVQQNINEIKKHTGSVNQSVGSSNTALSEAAKRASDVSGNISSINNDAQTATSISSELGEAVSRFKVD